MKTLQPFIDLGFHTVPLRGELKRLESGKKTIPIYEIGWKDKYAETFNRKAVKLGGALTGKLSGCIAIDCDSAITYSLFSALDTTNKFHFLSKGKPQGGGTILYKYPSAEIPSFSIQNATLNLDFYSDKGFVYLPTDANESKERWGVETFEELPKLMDMPLEVQLLLTTLHDQYKLSKAPLAEQKEAPKTAQLANYLAPAVQLMLDNDQFSPTLFRIITPKDFRELPQYVDKGYLHPENVPDGRGSEYLSKISAILGKDSSMSKLLYEQVMQFINGLWKDPMPVKQLLVTIINPMMSGKAAINGEPIWTYDENWNDKGFSFINKLGEAVEVFFDDVRAQYHLVNFTRDNVTVYSKDTEIFNYIETVGLGLPQRKSFKEIMPLIRTTNDPSLPFGFFSHDNYTRMFNTFNQTPELAILTNPESYAARYRKPEITLQFLESLVPHDSTRDYLLQFLRKKLTTFSYSPVVLYFLGAHGSGKDTFVSLLANMIGSDYIARPTTREFLEQYNGWIVDKYFIQLDEYGNQLTRFQDKQEALGKIKAYSGKQNIQIRQMRTDGFNYDHSATFIMTANTNPLLLEQGDRRALIIETPNDLAKAQWVNEVGGLSAVQTGLVNEIRDFCYYLSTEIIDMSIDSYVQPPFSKAKHTIIAKSLPAGVRLAYYLKHSMFDKIEALADEYEVPGIFAHYANQRLYEDVLFELYLQMTDNAGSKRGLNVAMSDAQLSKVPTTKDGAKMYYFKIPTLMYYTPKQEAFTEIEVDLNEEEMS